MDPIPNLSQAPRESILKVEVKSLSSLILVETSALASSLENLVAFEAESAAIKSGIVSSIIAFCVSLQVPLSHKASCMDFFSSSVRTPSGAKPLS